MKVVIFENVKELNDYLKHKKAPEIVNFFHSFTVVGKTKDQNGRDSWEVIDRFVVLEK